MILVQITWIGRINALFTTLLGTCAGMSILNIFFLAVSDEEEIKNFYAQYAVSINMVFLILANLVLLLGISLMLHYDQKSTEKVNASKIDY